MMRVAGIILVSFTIFCYSYNYAVASMNHKESSTTLKLDPSNKVPVFQHSTCTCNTEAQIVINDTQKEAPSIPLNICHCRTCIAQDTDEHGNSNLHCVEHVMTEEEYRSLLAQSKLSEPAHPSTRKKRSPYTWEELLEKISFMGSHDSTFNKRTQGYFHYNYANSSAGTSHNPPTPPSNPPQTTATSTTSTTTSTSVLISTITTSGGTTDTVATIGAGSTDTTTAPPASTGNAGG
ncbi:uncharacterized protein LOC109621467 isoform X1 [Aedes albopictus]|uniref:Secreted protein n=1 Tax=Aedes albopictus TaxID=7160 RepID=A0ABM2A0Z2_AEDAL